MIQVICNDINYIYAHTYEMETFLNRQTTSE